MSCVNGACLLPYRDLLAGVMDIVLQLHSRHGVEIAGQILRFMLRSLCLSSPLEIRGFIGDIDLPLAEYLPIRVRCFYAFNLYIYIYMYVHVNIYIYTCMYAYKHICNAY